MLYIIHEFNIIGQPYEPLRTRITQHRLRRARNAYTYINSRLFTLIQRIYFLYGSRNVKLSAMSKKSKSKN